MADHTATDRPPLWRAMRRAESSCATDLTSSDARMICAVRDWLVPEEPEPRSHLVDGECNPLWDDWHARQRLRAQLTAEIDRAERGEGGNA